MIVLSMKRCYGMHDQSPIKYETIGFVPINLSYSHLKITMCYGRTIRLSHGRKKTKSLRRGLVDYKQKTSCQIKNDELLHSQVDLLPTKWMVRTKLKIVGDKTKDIQVPYSWEVEKTHQDDSLYYIFLISQCNI